MKNFPNIIFTFSLKNKYAVNGCIGIIAVGYGRVSRCWCSALCGLKISLVMAVSRNTISFVSAETLEVDFVVIFSIAINKLQYES